MKIQLLTKLGTALAIVSVLTACGTSQENALVTAKQNKKLNILYIMSDDHTRQGVGAYGGLLSSLDPTPTIDALAGEGTRFDNVFVTNSICTPSRASIITGQYSQTNGALDLQE